MKVVDNKTVSTMITEELDINFVAQAKMARVLKLMRLLCEYRFTIAELSEQLDSNERTVYRYLSLLEFMDVQVEKDFEKKYFIVEGNCPFCGKANENNH